MLTSKQRRYLKKLAHDEKAIFQIGKAGITDNMISQLNNALERRELLKITVLQNCPLKKEVAAEQLTNGTGAETVQIIGRQIVLYKESTDHKTIILPDKNNK